jgi:6-phosphofructokinase 1
MTRRPTIGILTGGGDCPGLNAVIRAATKSAIRLGYDCVGFLRGYEGLVDPVSYMPLDAHNTAGILLQGGTILGSTNKGRFTSLVGEGERVGIDPELLARAASTVKQMGIAGLICVGGDGSLGIAQQLHEHGVPVVGVPKTIDNDLGCTAFTFGFDSAVATATDALDRLHTTAASHERVMVLEVMGRHAGWIALHSGIASGGDVILLPEIAWTFENVCRTVMHRDREGKRYTLIVVAEGAHLPDGGLVHCGESGGRGQVKLGGIGEIVAREIAARLGREVRTVVLGHLQRGGTPTAFDRMLATEFGAHATRLVHEGRFGEMVCYRPPDIASVPIAEAIGRLSTVDPRGSAVQAARALGIGFGDDEDGDPFAGGGGPKPLATT